MDFSNDDSWALLELDFHSSNERDLKRAYARLLKLHRPDQDPEGFRRVNGAYQTALADLRRRDAAPDLPDEIKIDPIPLLDLPESSCEIAPATAPETMPYEPPPAMVPQEENFQNLPKEFLTGYRNLKTSLERGEQLMAVEEFILLRDKVRAEPDLAASWLAMLRELFAGGLAPYFLPLLHPVDVMAFLRQDENDFTANVILTWRNDPDLFFRLAELGDLMLDSPAGDDPAVLRTMWLTARLAAFHLPEISGRLADVLYRRMKPENRELMANEVEMRSAAGQLFSQFSWNERRFWEHCLFDSGGEPPDWGHPAAQTLLQNVVDACSDRWDGWPLVSKMVPENILNSLLNQAYLRPSSKRARRASRVSSSVRSLFKSLWNIFFAIFITMAVVIVAAVWFSPDPVDRTLRPAKNRPIPNSQPLTGKPSLKPEKDKRSKMLPAEMDIKSPALNDFSGGGGRTSTLPSGDLWNQPAEQPSGSSPYNEKGWLKIIPDK